MKKYLAHIMLTAIFGGVFWLGSGSASAATLTWDGGGDGVNWADGTNWDTDSAPVNGDDLVFDHSLFSDQDTITNNISGLSLAGIAITGDNSAGSYKSVSVDGNNVSTANVNFMDSSAAVNWGFDVGVDLTLSANATLGADALQSFNDVDLGSYTLDYTASGSGSHVSIMGTLSGSGAITIEMGSLTVFDPTVANTYTGTVNVNNLGRLYVYSADALANVQGIVVANGGGVTFAKDTSVYAMPVTLSGLGPDYGSGPSAKIQAFPSLSSGGGAPSEPDGTATFANLTLTSNVEFFGYSNLTIQNLTGDYTITNRSGSIGVITLPGGGTVESEETVTTIDGNDKDAGQDLIIGGKTTFIVNGERGDVSLASGGTLKGSGKVANIYMSGGTLAPGTSPGCLTTGSVVSATIVGTLEIEIAGTTACSGYDQVILSGGSIDSNVSALSLDVKHLNSFASNDGDTFVIINNTGANSITGTFDGLPDNATFVADGMTYRINYNAGDGNDIVLTRVALPGEPTTGVFGLANNVWMMFALGAAMIAASGVLLSKRV